MYRNLRQFIQKLKAEDELVEIHAEVDPFLELAEIHRRVIEEGGPALLFTQVKGSSFPVVTNLFGTPRRVEMAFGPRPEQLMKQIVSLMDKLMPPTPKAIWNERNVFKELLKVGLKTVPANKAPVLETKQNETDLTRLPVITSWQEDGGPFITLPLVYTEHPQSKQHNLGMYRMQIFDKQTTGMHWQIHKGGGFHHYEAEKRNEPLPVHVHLGGPPALIASAIAPVPEFLPELILTSLIMGEKLPVVTGKNGYPFIAEAEFVLTGSVPPHERRLEGPFGDHYGYYSLAHEFPVFHVKEVYHRKDAIYPATVVGKPRQEDYYMGEFLQRLLSPAFPMVMPGVRDLWTYSETGFHSLAAAVVRESYQREVLANAFRILGEGQLTLTKFLILTDQSVSLGDFPKLFETVLERMDPATDLFIFNHTSMDTLDYTGKRLNHGSKAVLIGTGEPKRTLPASFHGPDMKGIRDARVYCKGALVLEAEPYEQNPKLAEQILRDHKEDLAGWPFVFLVDDIEAASGQTAFLWTIFTRFNPAFDIHAQTRFQHHHPHYQFPFIVDARMKPGYPDELVPDPSITKKVDERWKEYFGS
ncbi:MAG: menaquinone biosynthesis decarboxylase [Thermoactinomyces vulgaris]|uniref:Menaquinone biosynthesis decarboxylase n=1 Tax=Thermoactinomyces vulgaris TaxID=2026 RepID=A0ABS0QIE8_THEVU|nr:MULTISPECIES: menaquinone biosynthesis decarboxylase [Thermoactinomyces]KFZ41012.1 4-hydroxybenzoate decarboxylase [Thermoactinomyces sp. Gus2-1]KYQ87199.1 4-hydroxybenzoate decarboxylase [Thermoactinomyces sp. AS95]MBA4552134.1 menaquinone biosynthesis decarboxylase [Thermoactinomyces vulgaris]MBA4597376.1 menaquinone biosynthesis decarboxylase [Thermoactinomyces vulgaris]MBH8584207.1 menaquinone biosynthesis decarboxylase [Thermoactinomyces sp. CICC 10735]